MIPCSSGGDLTRTVGYFDLGTAEFSMWLNDALGRNFDVVDQRLDSLEHARVVLAPTPHVSVRVCVPLGSWTILLTNGPRGTDVGAIPSHVARRFGVRTIRAVSSGEEQPYPANILEVYGPDGAPPLAARRTITAANDGGKWVFETSGEPFAFEDLAAYTNRLKRKRFTPSMLCRYLENLGVPVSLEPKWKGAIVIARVT